MEDRIGDTTLGMGQQARAVLEFLADIVPDFADYRSGFYQVRLETRPWYNGREKGFVISMGCGLTGDNRVVHIAVFEHRNSDEICTLVWETERFYWDGPNSDPDVLEAAYHGGNKYGFTASFSYGEVGKVADWVYKTLEEFHNEQSKEDAA